MRGLAPTKHGVSRSAVCDKRESSIAKPEFRNRLRFYRKGDCVTMREITVNNTMMMEMYMCRMCMMPRALNTDSPVSISV